MNSNTHLAIFILSYMGVVAAISAGIYYLFIIIPKENIYWVLLVISALIVFILAFAGLARLMRKTNPNRRN
ncbi:MAG: hypothetical protein ACYCSA_03935 [Thermoplasmataceae archaeon]